ncbi:hypothetical protein V9T40_006262 [Parthenolecanium corni]|uniref:Uncharacterized protein n=1 Tax=Parthenolecanium corni TaxID=536013 RepID=A0AAN9Y600_9HEMI
MSTIAVEKCGRNAIEDNPYIVMPHLLPLPISHAGLLLTHTSNAYSTVVLTKRPCDYVNLPQYAQTGPASVLRRLFTPSTTADPYKTTSIGRYLSVGENDSEDDDI